MYTQNTETRRCSLVKENCGHAPGSVSRLRAVHTSWNSWAHPIATICGRPAAVAASRYGASTSALRSPAVNRITGMPLARARSLMSFRNFSPIGSNSAGDTIGLPR
jgi:hypothetical protein